jgi:type VI secretion system ImpC/EvpB family protein
MADTSQFQSVVSPAIDAAPLVASVPAELRPATNLLDLVLEERLRGSESPALLDRFLAEPSIVHCISLWTGRSTADIRTEGKERLLARLDRDIARLDELLTAQVNAILHHPRFQQLEASWRGLHFLVEKADAAEGVKVRVLGASWKEIVRDLDRAIEFDQSQLFNKIYSEEFGTPGGEPFGVILGDYEMWPRPSAAHPVNDIEALQKISGVAAAAFAPFIAGVHPAMFGLDRFSELEQPLKLGRTFDQMEYFHWNNLRKEEDVRFVGLTMPRVLMRLPYEDDGSRADGFRFREDVTTPDRSNYLWGTAVYSFGAVLLQTFARSGWLAEIRGVKPGGEGGGVVTGLPVHSFTTDKHGVVPKCSTDVMLTDYQEQELGELGFLPLCHCPDTELSVFYTNQSIQQAKKYDTPAATMNARISAMLQYILCASRFAHYLKVIARDKIGSFQEAGECEEYLHNWLQQYVTSDAEASPATKARFPLREARIKVEENRGKPGSYLCTAHLWPHFQLDGLNAAIRLRTELTPARVV